MYRLRVVKSFHEHVFTVCNHVFLILSIKDYLFWHGKSMIGNKWGIERFARQIFR